MTRLLVLAALLASPAVASAQVDFIRGDANGTGNLDIADAVYSLNHLFASGPAICFDAIDANDDGQANLADPIYFLNWQFNGGPPPPAPFPGPGDDPTADSLNCAPPTAFRITSLSIRDPHVFTQFIVCIDSTVTLNTLIADSFTSDADLDGVLDQSFLLVFRPLDATGAGGRVDFITNSECTAPAAGTTCQVDVGSAFEILDHTNSPTGTCLAPVPMTTSGYAPPITNPIGPCFSTSPASLTIDLAGIVVPLTGARLGGTYVGSPPSSIVNGLGYGFIAETTANATILPPSLAIVGGLPLSQLLPGGAGNCSMNDDRDLGPDGVTMGWWVYFNFEAQQVPYQGP